MRVSCPRSFQPSASATEIRSPQSLYVAIIIQILLPFFAKLTVLLLYLRLFKAKTTMKWATYLLIACLSLMTIIFEFTIIFACSPVRKAWDITVIDGSCLNVAVNGIVGASLNALTDFLVLILPLPVLRSLNLPKGRKWQYWLYSLSEACTFLTSVDEAYQTSLIALTVLQP